MQLSIGTVCLFKYDNDSAKRVVIIDYAKNTWLPYCIRYLDTDGTSVAARDELIPIEDPNTILKSLITHE